jgi:hypothetical protein
MSPRIFRWSVLLLLLAALAGCSGRPPWGTVKGRVSLGSQPVTEATIIFENSESGIAVTCPLREDGRYEIATYHGPGLPVGTYRVAVAPGGRMRDGDDSPLAGKNPPPPKKKTASPIPSRFHTATASPLLAEVREGENPAFDFDLSAGK